MNESGAVPVEYWAGSHSVVDHHLKTRCLGFLHNPYGPYADILWLPVLFIYEISVRVSASISVSCAFLWLFFFFFVLFWFI